MWTVMDAAAREEFLAGAHVGVLSGALGAPGRTQSAVPGPGTTSPAGRPVTVLTAAGRARPRRSARRAGSACAPRTSTRPTATSASRAPVVSEEEPSAAERLALARRDPGTARR